MAWVRQQERHNKQELQRANERADQQGPDNCRLHRMVSQQEVDLSRISEENTKTNMANAELNKRIEQLEEELSLSQTQEAVGQIKVAACERKSRRAAEVEGRAIELLRAQEEQTEDLRRSVNNQRQ